MDEILFTPVAVLNLLHSISELEGCDIELVETSEGKIQFAINESLYNVDTSSAVVIDAPEETVAEVQEVNDSEYSDIVDSSYTADMVSIGNEDINSGIVKEVAKTLLVGGLVRLTSKLLRR